MTALEFKDLKAVLPRQISDEMITTTKTLSTVAKLSNQEPMRFGEIDFISFTDTVRAEFVEESGDKSGTTAGWSKVTAVPPLGGSVEVSPPRQRHSIPTLYIKEKNFMHVPFWIRFPSSLTGFPCHCNEKPRVLNENSGQQGGRRDLNPRPPGPQPGALPTELHPP